MKNIILLAAPAAGKGTQSELLCDKYGFLHISSGDLLRETLKTESELSIKLKEIMDSGNLVSDDLIFELLENKLKNENLSNGLILDGTPRNLKQAELLKDLFKKLNLDLDLVLYLSIDKEIAKKRITGRLTCPNCKTVYNNKFEELSPKIENICDNCNSPLNHRSDDNEETFENRYKTYLEDTKPLIDYYNNLGLLKEVDSSQDKLVVFNQIEKILGEI